MISVTAGGSVRMVIYDSRVDSWHFPGGMVFRYVNQEGRTVIGLARLLAPERTGRLKRGLRLDTRPLARRQVVSRVRSTARHSKWVHGGRPAQVGFRKLTGAPPGPGSGGKWVSSSGLAARTADGTIMSYLPDATRHGVAAAPSQPFLTEAMFMAAPGQGRRRARFGAVRR
jgi:hypothetical protein